MSRRNGRSAKGRARDRPTAAETAQQRTPAARAQSTPYAGRGASLRLMQGARTGHDMASSEVIYAAVMRIANTLATMPVHLYKGGERQRGDIRDHLLSLRPNRRQSAWQFKQAMEICRNVEGRAYAVKRFDGAGQLREIECLNPRLVTPMESQETGDIWYAVAREDGTTEYLHNWYVMPLVHASTNGVSAIRVVDVLAGTINYSRDVNTFSLEAIKAVNNAVVLEYPLNLSGQRRVDSVKETLDIYRENGGKVLALESGVKASLLAGTAIDAGVFDVERVTRSRAALVYGLAPYELGDYSDGEPGTPEQQNIELLTKTMNPIVTQWVEGLSWWLLTPQERESGWEYRFDMQAYLRADGATLASIRQSQIRCGSRTVNEIRAQDYLPPVEGGDEPFVSKDLAPVRMVAAGATIDLATIAGEHNSGNTGKAEE